MKKLLSVLLMFCMVMVAGGCGKTEQKNDAAKTVEKVEQKDAGQSDATVVVGIKGSILTLDPANYRDRVTESVLRNIFDGLVTMDDNGQIIPKVAESWESISPTEYTFKIRKGIKFHDGSDVTAEDVKFTFERVINEKAMGGETSPRKGLIEPLKAVEKLDDYTVKFILSEPWPILIKMLPNQQIVPKAYLQKVGDAEFRKKPIGAGPFKFVEGKLDEKIVLQRFDEYYDGKAAIKNLVFEVIPENSSRVAALQSGEVQRIHSISPAMAKDLEKNSKIDVKSVDGTRVYMLHMNNAKAPFDNVLVRKAVNHAIDFQLIIDKILEGNGTRLAGPMLQNAYAISKELKPYEYNPEKAKQLLKEAGYPDGFKAVIDTEASNKEVAEAVAAQLRNVGIDASSRVWDGGVVKPMLLKGERQMFMGDWGNSTLDPYDFLNPCFITGQRGNYSCYSNKTVDSLLQQGSVEMNDGKRQQIYKEAQKIIYDEAPWAFGYQTKEFEAGLKQLKDWSPGADGMLYMLKARLEK